MCVCVGKKSQQSVRMKGLVRLFISLSPEQAEKQRSIKEARASVRCFSFPNVESVLQASIMHDMNFRPCLTCAGLCWCKACHVCGHVCVCEVVPHVICLVAEG